MLADPTDDPQRDENPDSTPHVLHVAERTRALIWTDEIAAAARILADPTTVPAHRPLAAATIIRRLDDIATLLGIDLNQATT